MRRLWHFGGAAGTGAAGGSAQPGPGADRHEDAAETGYAAQPARPSIMQLIRAGLAAR